MGKVAVITGIFGQDGSLLAELLLSKGYHVFGFVKSNSISKVKLHPDKRKLLNLCEIIETDITNRNEMYKHIGSICPDYFFHLAACHHSSERDMQFDINLYESMVKTNFESTCIFVNTLMEIKKNCRFLFAGSSQMFTPITSETRITEETPFSPSTFYGHTKVWSHQLIKYYREKYKFWGCTAILFNHESPRRSNDFVTRKITEAVAKIKFGLKDSIEIQNVYSQADWGCAEDFVQAMYLMLNADIPKDYVLSSGESHKVQDILSAAFSHVGLDWQKYTNFNDKNTETKPSLIGDSSKIEQNLGWRPTKDFETWICEMVDFDYYLVKDSFKIKTSVDDF